METSRQHKGHPPRLRSWDYSSVGAYFVTFVVKGKVRCLSTIEYGRLQLIRWGEIVQNCWFGLPSQFQSVILDEIVIMPNHVHAIIFLTETGMKGALLHQGSTGRGSTLKPMMADPRLVLGKVIRAWKAKSTRMIHEVGDPSFAWQSRYYEHIIRNELELDRIRTYIANNPAQWDIDVENPER